MRLLACLLMTLLLTGCSKEDMFNAFASPEDQARAKDYLSQIHAHDFTAVEKDIDPSLNNSEFPALLERMANATPAGEPTSVKLVGAQLFNHADAKTVNTTFEYQYGDTWFIENLAIREKDGVKTIAGLHIVPETASLEETNRFRLSGKSAVQYTILASAVVAVILTLSALVLCIRTKGLRRKFLWILFVLVGFGSISVNWTTGQWTLKLLSLQLFGAGASAQFYGPWIVTMSLPVGAIVFLIKTWRRAKTGEPQSAR